MNLFIFHIITRSITTFSIYENTFPNLMFWYFHRFQRLVFFCEKTIFEKSWSKLRTWSGIFGVTQQKTDTLLHWRILSRKYYIIKIIITALLLLPSLLLLLPPATAAILLAALITIYLLFYFNSSYLPLSLPIFLLYFYFPFFYWINIVVFLPSNSFSEIIIPQHRVIYRNDGYCWYHCFCHWYQHFISNSSFNGNIIQVSDYLWLITVNWSIYVVINGYLHIFLLHSLLFSLIASSIPHFGNICDIYGTFHIIITAVIVILRVEISLFFITLDDLAQSYFHPLLFRRTEKNK